jgi:hypothetical protein
MNIHGKNETKILKNVSQKRELIRQFELQNWKVFLSGTLDGFYPN